MFDQEREDGKTLQLVATQDLKFLHRRPAFEGHSSETQAENFTTVFIEENRSTGKFDSPAQSLVFLFDQ